ncbi:ParA family protein [Pseudactinotalea sp. HY160]|uniref:nucleotide-binding protein n=1 Tax=Pseudactinotalea sp. HY160 TaxID=2654490 RepID=UPI0018837855
MADAGPLDELDDLFSGQHGSTGGHGSAGGHGSTGQRGSVGGAAARSGRPGDVLIVMSAKGGVGKSTTSLNLAQYAAEYGPDGYRVTLIDANRGQGDVRTYLRLHNARTATIYDAARTGDPATGLLTPSDIAQFRDARWGSVDFALIPAPPSSLADPEVVTARVYADAIAYAREVSDLVVVDTQISEEHDTTNLWDRALIPLLREGAWCLSITQPIPPAVKNLIERLQWFDQIGIGPARVMSFVNMVDEGDAETADALVTRLGQVSTCLGWIPQDADVESASSLGRFVTDNPNFGPVLATALSNVTGLPGFDPSRHDEAPVGLLGRLLGRRKGR